MATTPSGPDHASASVAEVTTPHGPARVHLDSPAGSRATVMLGHGAGGGVTAGDLTLAASVARRAGLGVALVEQPYRVAGRRAPAPARQLDAAWVAVAAWLREQAGDRTPLVTGGRSSGARVACRTAAEVGAVGVLCLAFPLRPPGRADRPSRLPELDGVTVPTLVVQGSRDPFGMPPSGPDRRVVVVDGDHSLAKDHPNIRSAVEEWMTELLSP
ncbi:alpha/beta hydrolase [Georgenia yuyongxinii]|uniref:Alpha/beta hydrolase n=1 Tax=Georgenia yuyongxinii TaxID=2589797 RepID=A0A5B8C8J5_9MICO|nr:alpha/beta family hydrolase [Georgenia yuyongxinii]QDC24286.1 alpha/beta hydrolase [Georgenia yuyongxinii]